MVYELDTLRVLEVNRAFARKFGQPAPVWCGQTMQALVHPDDSGDWQSYAGRVTRPPSIFRVSIAGRRPRAGAGSPGRRRRCASRTVRCARCARWVVM